MTEKNELETLSSIQQMAILNLRGDGFSDYQKAKALDIAFETVKNVPRDMKKEDIFAAASKKIFTFLDNDIKKRYPQGQGAGEKTIKKIEQFINLFRKLCKEEYHNSLRQMYKNRFPIRSAYLWYIDQVIRQNIEKKKEKSDET